VPASSCSLSEALLAHDLYVCLKRPSGALPPEVMSRSLALSPRLPAGWWPAEGSLASCVRVFFIFFGQRSYVYFAAFTYIV